MELADDDEEDVGNALGPYHAQCEGGGFAVVRAVGEELLDVSHWPWVAPICDERSSPISLLFLSSSVLLLSLSAGPTTTSASSTIGEHPLLVGFRCCGPNSRMALQS